MGSILDKYRIKNHWLVTVPVVIIALELISLRGYPFTHPYLYLMIKSQPLQTVGVLLLAFFRLLAFYLVIFGFSLLMGGGSNKRTTLIFGGFYFLSCLSLWMDNPGFWVRYPMISLLLPFLAVGLIPAFWSIQWRSPNRYLIAILVGCLCFLLFSRPPRWKESKTVGKGSSTLPSFVLFGVDSVPGSLFYEEEEGERAYVPRWGKTWAGEAKEFRQAYAVTNSTWTSWHSILSGKLPSETGVESLFPPARMSKTGQGDWLPSQLKDLGYQTVLMTDCGTTAFMGETPGFQSQYVLADTPYGCAQSALVASHPLVALDYWMTGNQLLSESNSFCSPMYHPHTFFERVEAKYIELIKNQRPFFLLVHSCLVHQTAQRHLPGWRSGIHPKKNHSAVSSAQMEQLKLSLRWWDWFLDRFLKVRAQFGNRSWFFLLADHGVFIEKQGESLKRFSHGEGPPKSKFQYHVPLAVLPPMGHSDISLEASSSLRLLPDINNTIKSLVGISDAKELSLLSPGITSRGTVLSTALHDHQALARDWQRLEVTEGAIRMNPALDLQYRSRTPVAYLSLPYRLIAYPSGHRELFNEALDPYNSLDISEDHPKVVEDLQSRLCKSIPSLSCPQTD